MFAAALETAGLTIIALRFSLRCGTRRFGDFALVASFKDLFIMQNQKPFSERKKGLFLRGKFSFEYSFLTFGGRMGWQISELA